ncbi:unnamed protein product, partial [Adineta ricciae]
LSFLVLPVIPSRVAISLPVGYRPNSIKFLSFYGYSHGYPSRYPLGIDQIRSNSSASTDTAMGIHLVTRRVSTKFDQIPPDSEYTVVDF